MTGVLEEKPHWSGLPPETKVVSVAVRFLLDRTFWSSFVDPSLEEGLTVWGYRLTQDSASGRRMIFDEGQFRPEGQAQKQTEADHSCFNASTIPARGRQASDVAAERAPLRATDDAAGLVSVHRLRHAGGM